MKTAVMCQAGLAKDSCHVPGWFAKRQLPGARLFCQKTAGMGQAGLSKDSCHVPDWFDKRQLSYVRLC